MKKFSLGCFAIAALAVVGCQKSDPIVGKWVLDGKSANPMITAQSMTFSADGTFSTSSTIGGTDSRSMTSTDKGKWSWDADKKLKLNYEDIVFEFKGLDEKTKSMIETQMKSGKAAIIKEMNGKGPLEVKFEGEGMSIIDPSGTMKFKRG